MSCLLVLLYFPLEEPMDLNLQMCATILLALDLFIYSDFFFVTLKVLNLISVFYIFPIIIKSQWSKVHK